jgi:hypothetical protein
LKTRTYKLWSREEISRLIRMHNLGSSVCKIAEALKRPIGSIYHKSILLNLQPLPLKDRFWKCVQKTDECWTWTAATTRAGYGVIRDENGKLLYAHHVSWLLAGNKKARLLMHECDCPGCVNPKHLKPGTHQMNVDDKVAKLRHRFGERNPMSKLVEEQVREIRELFRIGGISQSELGKRYRVHQSLISLIVRRKIWRRTL